MKNNQARVFKIPPDILGKISELRKVDHEIYLIAEYYYLQVFSSLDEMSNMVVNDFKTRHRANHPYTDDEFLAEVDLKYFHFCLERFLDFGITLYDADDEKNVKSLLNKFIKEIEQTEYPEEDENEDF